MSTIGNISVLEVDENLILSTQEDPAGISLVEIETLPDDNNITVTEAIEGIGLINIAEEPTENTIQVTEESDDIGLIAVTIDPESEIVILESNDVIGNVTIYLDSIVVIQNAGDYHLHKTDMALIGLVNGVNRNFRTTLPYKPGSLQVYLNGVCQHREDDFTETGADTLEFTLAPHTGDHIIASYIMN